jgi:hypothetical protein
MLLVDEIAQIIRVNDHKIGAGQTAQIIVNLLAEKKLGYMEDCHGIANKECVNCFSNKHRYDCEIFCRIARSD